MQVNTYLSFNGECEAAFKFYEQCLGGRIAAMFRYEGTPLAATVPADWSDKVMHASVVVDGQELMGADVAPEQYEPPKGISLSLNLGTAAEAERVFGEFADGGRIVQPLERTFWSERFGMVIDRFGVPWMINCEEAPQTS